MKNTIVDNKDASPELLTELRQIHDRCLPPERFWFKTFYAFLFAGSLVPHFIHSAVYQNLAWDSLRMGNGLLPFMVLAMRNTLIPVIMPVFVVLPGLLSLRFRFLQTSAFLAWLAFFELAMVLLYLFVSGMFANHLTLILRLY